MSTLDDLRKLREDIGEDSPDKVDGLGPANYDRYITHRASKGHLRKVADPLLAYTIRLAEAAAIVNHTGGDDVGTLIGLEVALDAPIEGLTA